MTIAAMNTINNTDIMLAAASTETTDVDFSKLLDEKLDETDKLAEFKEFLQETISEANVETSLDLTLTKDVAETIENIETTEEEAENDSELILFAQVLEGANQTITPQIPTLESEVSNTVETSADIETAPAKQETVEEPEVNIDEDMIKELNIESIESDSSTSENNSSLMNRQTPEEQGIKILLHQEAGVKNFEVQTPQAVSKPAEVTPSKIIEQVTKHLETLQNNSKVNIVLNPESLGKISIQLVKSPEGLSAQFTTATQEARNLLMKGLDGLKESLSAHGIGVDNVTVKVSDTQKSEYNPDWTEQDGSRGGNKEQNPQRRNEKEKGLFERTMGGFVNRDS